MIRRALIELVAWAIGFGDWLGGHIDDMLVGDSAWEWTYTSDRQGAWRDTND